MIEIHLKKKPKWYLEDINPYGMVPTIEHDNHIIRESAVTFGEKKFSLIVAHVMVIIGFLGQIILMKCLVTINSGQLILTCVYRPDCC